VIARRLAVLAFIALTGIVVAQDESKTVAFGDAPAGWKALPARSGMMVPKLEFELPAAEGDADPGKVTVHYFGSDGAGGWKANLERWASQFKNEDGSAVDPEKVKIEEADANGLKVKIAYLEGTWTPPSFGPMAKKNPPKPGSRMLAAVVEGPDGPWFVRLVGAKKTVEKHEADYLKWLKSAKAAEKK
jgi:hypothetical protein